MAVCDSAWEFSSIMTATGEWSLSEMVSSWCGHMTGWRGDSARWSRISSLAASLFWNQNLSATSDSRSQAEGGEVYAACAWCESRIWAFGRRMLRIKSLQKSSGNSILDVYNPWKQLFSDNLPLNRSCLIFGNIICREKTRAARSWATVNSLVTLSKSL